MADKVCCKETEIAVLKHQFEYMKQEIEEIKDGQKDIIHKIEELWKSFSSSLARHVDESDKKYATKTEHAHNLERISKIESSINKLLWIVIAAILASVLKLVLI